MSETELAKQRVAPAAAVEQLGNRIVIAEIPADVSSGTSIFLRALYDRGVKPSLIVIRRNSDAAATMATQDLEKAVAALDSVLRPMIAAAAMKMSKRPDQGREVGTSEQNRAIAALTPGNSLIWEPVSPAGKQAIDAAIPRSPIVEPAKPRKLLVIDFNLGYPGHTSIPTHNYGLQRLGAVTGAYAATFDNDLENLKYPRIKQFDAIFLNNTVGLIFSDPAVRDGLARFVREGGGLGGNHAATHASLDWPEFAAMIGAYPGGHLDPTEEVWLKIDDPASAINAAFEGKAFKYQDEYFRFPGPSYSRDHLHVLLSIDVARTDMFQVSADRLRQMTSVAGSRVLRSLEREDADFAVSWIKTYGQGRVFYTTLGHTPALFMTPEMAHHMLGGLQYILGDLPADASASAVVLSTSRR